MQDSRIKTYLKHLLIFAGITLMLAIGDDTFAQCAMCKGSAETSLEEGAHAARTINKGILYMLMMPFLIAGTIGFVWWKSNRGLIEHREETANAY